MTGHEQRDPASETARNTVRVRFFASARAAAGTERDQLSLAPEASLSDALDQLRERYSADLDKILTAASFLVNGVAVRDRTATLPVAAELDVLPPFAGG